MSEQIVDGNGHSLHSVALTKLLRLASIILVGLSIVIVHFLDVRQIGESMESSNGNVAISAGSHPVMLAWTAIAIGLFVVLMVRKPNAVTAGIPTLKRRVLAFVIDFWFSLLAISSVSGLVPLWLEAVRTGHFMWYFHRNYSVAIDGFSVAFSILFLAPILLYYVFPLTRGRQTVGYFIMRLRVTPPFGNEGRFTLKAALMRTFYAFRGLCSLFNRRWDRDEQGRTWWDRRSACTVVLVSDQ